MKTLYTLLFTFIFTLCMIISASGQDLDMDLTDIDGNIHNIQDYHDQGKTVFIFNFSNDWTAWYGYEAFYIHELYNTYGQGGNDDLVVLMVAHFGFDNAAELSGLDYSADLGAGYEDLSFTDDNPIPIILWEENPGMPIFSEGTTFNFYCPEGETGWVSTDDENEEDYINKVKTQCCTSLETFDPALNSLYTGNTPDCEPTAVDFQFANESSFDISSCDIDVYVNGTWFDQFEMTETIPGCTQSVITYQNSILAPGDLVLFVIAEDNDQYHNDSTVFNIEPVDTVRGHIRGEILAPLEEPYTAFIGSPNDNVWINAESNFSQDVFYETGCHYLEVIYPSWDTDMNGAHLHLASLNADGTYEKILADTVGDNFSWTYLHGFNLYVEEAVAQQAWGYVFEDVNDDQTFHPDVPRIPGVQVDHGPYTTFTNADGYYVFPEIEYGEAVDISYDEVTWPVITINGNGGVSWGNYINNFGLLSDDPVWGLTASFNGGVPYFCESGIGQFINVVNSGNQPISGTLVFTYDDQLTLQETNPEPSSVMGNVLTFDVPELGYNGSFSISAYFDTVSADLIGTEFMAEWALTGYDVDDNIVANSSEMVEDTLFCAYDPNDIYGFPLGSGPEGFIADDTPLKYRIRFQNTGNAPASNVVVVDTLPETLDWESFNPVSSTHEYQVLMNAETREVKWIFNGINLPDSASDLEGSIGQIFYDIEMADLEIGDQIFNQAQIYFDQNEAIFTNISVHTIADMGTGISESEMAFELYPNPTYSEIILRTHGAEGQQIEVMDLNGRVLKRSTVQSSVTRLDLNDLARGVYVVSLVDSGNGMRFSTKVVKM